MIWYCPNKVWVGQGGIIRWFIFWLYWSRGVLKPLLAKILPCYKVLLLANKKIPSRDLGCILLPRIDLAQPDKKQTWKCRSGTNYWTELLTWLCQDIKVSLHWVKHFLLFLPQLTLYFCTMYSVVIWYIKYVFNLHLLSISLYYY